MTDDQVADAIRRKTRSAIFFPDTRAPTLAKRCKATTVRSRLSWFGLEPNEQRS
jgi:hypothetical protein